MKLKFNAIVDSDYIYTAIARVDSIPDSVLNE